MFADRVNCTLFPDVIQSVETEKSAQKLDDGRKSHRWDRRLVPPFHPYNLCQEFSKRRAVLAATQRILNSLASCLPICPITNWERLTRSVAYSKHFGTRSENLSFRSCRQSLSNVAPSSTIYNKTSNSYVSLTLHILSQQGLASVPPSTALSSVLQRTNERQWLSAARSLRGGTRNAERPKETSWFGAVGDLSAGIKRAGFVIARVPRRARNCAEERRILRN